jgi:hypothetical protein
VVRNLDVDPVASLESAREHGWVPRDVRDDDVSICLVDNMGIYPKCRKALPFHVLPVP